MIVVVTGGCGFIGSNLVPVLLEAGHTVRVLDDLSTGRREAIPGDAVFLEGDVRNEANVRRAVEGADAVIHLAGQSGVVPSQLDPRHDFELNAGGTLTMLLESRDAGVSRFVFASSNAVAGEVEPPVHEGMPAQPRSPYGASKLAGEAYCAAFAGSYGLPAVALRFANVYGPRSSHKESVVARFIKDAMERAAVTIYGDGAQTRDLLHVSDLCGAILRTIDVPSLDARVLQVATGIETRIADVARLVGAGLQMPDLAIRFEPSRPGELRRNYARIDRARAALGWEPRIEVSRGIADTCRWFAGQAAVQREAGTAKREARSGKLEAGSGELEAGSGKREVESGHREA